MKLWLKIRRPIGFVLGMALCMFALIFIHAIPDMILSIVFGL